jgi:hypothetical protein
MHEGALHKSKWSTRLELNQIPTISHVPFSGRDHRPERAQGDLRQHHLLQVELHHPHAVQLPRRGDAQKGVRVYLHRFQYANAVTTDLWQAFCEASREVSESCFSVDPTRA